MAPFHVIQYILFKKGFNRIQINSNMANMFRNKWKPLSDPATASANRPWVSDGPATRGCNELQLLQCSYCQRHTHSWSIRLCFLRWCRQIGVGTLLQSLSLPLTHRSSRVTTRSCVFFPFPARKISGCLFSKLGYFTSVRKLLDSYETRKLFGDKDLPRWGNFNEDISPRSTVPYFLILIACRVRY